MDVTSDLAVVNENVSLVISRQVLVDFCNHLTQLPDDVAEDVAQFTLEKVQSRVISFEEQVSRISSEVATCRKVRNRKVSGNTITFRVKCMDQKVTDYLGNDTIFWFSRMRMWHSNQCVPHYIIWLNPINITASITRWLVSHLTLFGDGRKLPVGVQLILFCLLPHQDLPSLPSLVWVIIHMVDHSQSHVASVASLNRVLMWQLLKVT